MQPARRRTDVLGDGRGEGDDVVMGDLLDRVDALDVERRLRAQLARRVGWHDAGLGHDVGRRQFHREPAFEAALLGPDRAHRGVGITRNHSASCSVVKSDPFFGPSTVPTSGVSPNNISPTRSTSAFVTRSMPSSVSSSVKWRPK